MNRSTLSGNGRIKHRVSTLLSILIVLLLFYRTARAQAPVQPQQPVQAQAAPKTAGQGATKKSSATGTRQFDRTLLQPALLKAKAPETYQAKVTTTKGDFVISVHRDWAPLGADRFYNLVRHHFYDNASFFRTMPGFMTQFGISAYPQVNAALRNANIKDDPVTQSNKRGFITFATGGPNTRTTQVFINLVDNSRLDSQGFAPFGEVTEGMGVVDQLYGGYGDGPPQGAGPDQEQLQRQGKPYLDQGWPKLDSIKMATLLTPAPAAASKPATTKKAPTPQ
jgi:peptidyl-prolyl cis-trans isomerase A (cyclophilin A)